MLAPARPGTAYLPQVRCQQTDAQGRWNEPEPLLPSDEDRQYLPAATFHGETLWVATYVSDTARLAWWRCLTVSRASTQR